MSQWGVQLVIGKLVTDEEFRDRFEARSRETLAKLCEEGLDLDDAEMDALLATDSYIWADLARRIDRRLKVNHSLRAARSSSRNTTGLLTPRQRQVLRGIFEGRANKQIATEIGVSESAVKATLQHLFRKTHVRTRAQLVRIVIEGSPKAHPLK
jgi:DNA-binding NarL/FixJ family response regulator